MRKYYSLQIFCLLGTFSAVDAQEDNPDLYDIGGEFAFARVQYDSYYDGGWYGGPWATDFPAADENFLRGVSRLTNVREMSKPIVLRCDSEEIFDYPFLYALEMAVSNTHLTLPTTPFVYDQCGPGNAKKTR